MDNFNKHENIKIIQHYMAENKEPLLANNPKYQSYDFILKVVLNVSLSAVFSGYCLAYFNTITFDDTIAIFQITQNRAFMQGLLSFCIPAGAGIGGYFSNYLTKHYSRLQCNLIIAYVSLVSTLFMQSKSIMIMVICRFIQGVSVGVATVLRSIYIKEFSPIQIAGKFGSLNQVMFTIGLVYTFTQTYLFSFITIPENYWRIVYFFPAIINAVQIYNFKFNFPYETPKYLVQNYRQEEARQLLTIIYKPEYVEERLKQLQKAVTMANQPQAQQKEIQLKEVIDHSLISMPAKKTLKSNKLAVLAAHHISVVQQFTGIQIIIIYTGDIVLKIWPVLAKPLPIIIHTLGFIASYQTMKALDIYGRKQLMQKGLALLTILSFLFSLCFIWKGSNEKSSGDILLPSFIIIIGFIIFRMTFSLTMGPIVWLYLPQIVESDVIGLATMLNWFMAALVSFLFPVVVQLLGGPQYIFLILGILMSIGYYINQKLLVETKDKTEWQIRQQYDQMLNK